MTAYSDLKVGDRVALVRGDDTVSGDVTMSHGSPRLAGRTLQSWQGLGFTIASRTAATPVPTTHGLYADVDGDVWGLTSDGWRLVGYQYGTGATGSYDGPVTRAADVQGYGPFTRIRPSQETTS